MILPKYTGVFLKPFLSDPEFDQWQGSDGALTVCGAGINEPIEGLAFRTNPSALWHVELKEELGDEYILQQNYTYRTKDWRYIRYRNGKEELYHNKVDPYEWENMAVNKEYETKRLELRTKVLEMIVPKNQ